MLLRVFVCQNCSLDYIFVVFSSSFTFQSQYANETQIFTFHFCCNEKEPCLRTTLFALLVLLILPMILFASADFKSTVNLFNQQ